MATGSKTKRALFLKTCRLDAFKIGLLGSIENIAVIAGILADYPDIPVVLDPVLASGRGDELTDEDMISAIQEMLLPQTTVLTPNSIEARRLAQNDDEDRPSARGMCATADGLWVQICFDHWHA